MSSPNDWLQLLLFVGALLALTKPLGVHLTQVFDPRGRTFLDPIVGPLERLTYRVAGIDPEREQSWRGYTASLLAFSAVGLLFTYAVLRCQHLLPLNPQQLSGLAPALAFNTAGSFTTNTNWQSYGGEGTMSYFSQAVGLTLQNFTSAAAGLGVAAALVRGLARERAATVGSFWTDLVRTAACAAERSKPSTPDSCARATSSWSGPVNRFPATARSSMAPRPWTGPPSPADPRP